MKKISQRLRKQKGEAGFSLVEMVIAIVVLGILAVASYPLMFHSVQAVALNNVTTSATIKVQGIIEKIRVNPTCANINSIVSAPYSYTNARNVSYTVAISLPSGCTESQAVPILFKATRSFDSQVLINQNIQILVPPLSGVFTGLTPF